VAATALEEGMDSSGSPGPSAPHADAFEEPMDTISDGDAQDVTDEARDFDEGTREAMAPSDDEDVDELSGLRAKAAGGKPKGAARGPSDDTRDKVADAFIQSTLMTVTGAGEQSMAMPALSRKKADQEQQDTILTGSCGGPDAQVPREAQKPRAPTCSHTRSPRRSPGPA
jgi:hypothetical protein